MVIRTLLPCGISSFVTHFYASTQRVCSITCNECQQTGLIEPLWVSHFWSLILPTAWGIPCSSWFGQETPWNILWLALEYRVKGQWHAKIFTAGCPQLYIFCPSFSFSCPCNSHFCEHPAFTVSSQQKLQHAWFSLLRQVPLIHVLSCKPQLCILSLLCHGMTTCLGMASSLLTNSLLSPSVGGAVLLQCPKQTHSMQRHDLSFQKSYMYDIYITQILINTDSQTDRQTDTDRHTHTLWFESIFPSSQSTVLPWPI